MEKSGLAQYRGAESVLGGQILLRGAARVAIDCNFVERASPNCQLKQRFNSTGARSKPLHMLEKHKEIDRRAKQAADGLEKQ